MKNILKNNLVFFIPYLFFIGCGAILIAINSKAATHLEFNSFHFHSLDVLFTYLTYLGDGITATLVAIILLTVRFKDALIVGLSCILSGIITQFLKHTFFSDIVRPKKFFEGIHDLYLIPWVDNHLYNSFPSGHTACAFSLYLALALLTKNKKLKLLFFIIALSTGVSRIYLSQHFFEDVYAGSLIGVTAATFVFWYFNKKEEPKLESSLITLFKKANE